MTAGKAPNGSGSIWKRSNGTWAGGLYVDEADGDRRRHVFHARTRREVEEWLADLRRKSESGVPIAPSQLTVGAYLREWLDEVAAARVRPSTLTAYRHRIEHFLEPDLGKVRLGKLTAREVRRYLERLKQRGIGARTIRYVHATLRAALEDAVREELIEKNVAKLVRAPTVPKKEHHPLSVDETRAFLKANRDDRLYALLVVIALLGLRRSEALGLRWEDVDLDQGVLRVRRGLHRVSGQLVTMETKTARSRRTVPLPAFVVSILREHLARQEDECVAIGAGWHGSGHVFTTSIGTPLDPDNTTKFVKRALKTAGVRDVRMHDFRHGCVSVLLELRVPPRTVMEIVGHASLEMTMNVYGHVSLDDKKSALDQLGELFEEGS
ncbi:site-specific integrase [Nocardioides immobilis]|uniref:Site-specific integrase n=1 Tax=Nocardioides immobilis TaxID=2049295 RepID=A0A417XZL2_9ACTN|nr:tyrosine-type recombinase/integrase [Nocardioides immobilis]RHW25818.1 site-specific integrase [Nocardioides immobilis]